MHKDEGTRYGGIRCETRWNIFTHFPTGAFLWFMIRYIVSYMAQARSWIANNMFMQSIASSVVCDVCCKAGALISRSWFGWRDLPLQPYSF